MATKCAVDGCYCTIDIDTPRYICSHHSNEEVSAVLGGPISNRSDQEVHFQDGQFEAILNDVELPKPGGYGFNKPYSKPMPWKYWPEVTRER